MSWQIPLADLDFDAKEIEAARRVLEGKWLTMGSITQAFEEEFAELMHTRHAIAVTNGTAALHMACEAIGLGPGDEVILPALTFVATAAAVCYTGATPVFADIVSAVDLNISPVSISQNLTDRTRAIIVVHYGGYPCDMHAIMQLARANDLAVIEDAAHAPGSTLDDKHLGTWGNVGCFSFFSNKNLTTGEGGMLVTNDDIVSEKLLLLRSHGMTSLTWDRHKGHAWSYDVVELGYNYRIDELRAAIGRVQLGKLKDNNRLRRTLTAHYHKGLEDNAPQVLIPFLDYRGVSSCHLFPIVLPAGLDRSHFMQQMKGQGIQTSVHYPAIHQFHHYRTREVGVKSPLPITEDVASREVTLPLYPTLKFSGVDRVVAAVSSALQVATD